ncbi:DUF6693 family protein [Salinibius halmophilus]|uniref:DUF6693 family protein n=1 Tax=Salinibius halmophilus TaxID=1853216 RepID=UPI002D77E83F|nr:DUF6693 family protein [Salinibius halmophilus]
MEQTLRLKADISIIDILGHLIIWLFLSIITFGIALFFFPYSFSNFIINRTFFIDENGNCKRMFCNIDLFSKIGHIIVWIIISILTLGLGYIFYFYRVWNYALNNTSIVSKVGHPT